MNRKVCVVYAIGALLCCCALSVHLALGQEHPRTEIYGSYSFLGNDVTPFVSVGRNDFTPPLDERQFVFILNATALPTLGDLHGWNAALAFNLNPRWALVADVAGQYAPRNRFEVIDPAGSESVNVSGSQHTWLVGPRLTLLRTSRIRAFAQGFGGLSRLESRVSGPRTFQLAAPPDFQQYEVLFTGMKYGATSLVGSVGGGLDLRLSRRWSLRLVQLDYLLGERKLEAELEYVPEGSAAASVLRIPLRSFVHDNLRFSYGAVFAF